MKKGCKNCLRELIFQIAIIIAGINLALYLNKFFKSEFSLIAIIIISIAVAIGTKLNVRAD